MTGVFGLWYGKGPGVDRSGDVMRHANMAGTAPLAGCSWRWATTIPAKAPPRCTSPTGRWSMPICRCCRPPGVQEILDYGLYGFALSRFAGVWAGLKLMKDTVEATAVVDGRPDRMAFVTPDFDDARGRAEHPPAGYWWRRRRG
jgi:indolepyruvate ferredoxin oxidoreductase